MLQPNDSSPLQPMGFGDILDSTFSLYRARFGLFIGISSVEFAFSLIADLITAIFTLSLNNLGEVGWTIPIVVIVALIASFAAMLFVTCALEYGSAQAFLGRQISVRGAFRQTKRRLFPYLGTNILYLIVVVLLAITVIGIPFAIFFGVRWFFCSLAAVFEEKSAVQSLKRSGELVNGGWWRVFGMLIGIILLAFIVALILALLILFVLSFSQSMQVNGNILEMLERLILPELTSWDGLDRFTIQLIASIAIVTLMTPIVLIGTTLVYFDRRIRQEGFDIEMRATNEEA